MCVITKQVMSRSVLFFSCLVDLHIIYGLNSAAQESDNPQIVFFLS